MKTILWKRNAVVVTVLLFVCAAVYLNWRYAGNVANETGQESTQQQQEESRKVLGDATLVGGVPARLIRRLTDEPERVSEKSDR